MSSPSKRDNLETSTPRILQKGVSGTPIGRAKSAEPPSSRRSIHTPATGGGRTPGTQRQTLSASTRKLNVAATPHARAAFRALDSRRAAIFTPGKNRRRSGRDQRETPRDLLRNLSRKLAPTTRPITSSSSPGLQNAESEIGTILEDDEDDDIPIDRPRLSLPIDADEDDSDLYPHKSAGLEDENFTVQSIELPRRAASEHPRRFSRSSLGSIRMSDYIGGYDPLSDDVGVDSAFFPSAVFEDSGEGQEGEDITYERADSELGHRETLAAGRESDFGVIDLPGDANESTFFMAPQPQSPARPSLQFDQLLGMDEEPEADALEADDVEVGRDETGLEDIQAEGATGKAAAPRGRRKKRGIKVSKHGVEYPSLPPGVVKRLAQTLAKTSGIGKAKISADTLSAIMQASDWFLEQLGDDLQAYSKHAGRKTIDESDMLILMKRQRQTSSSTTPFALAQRHLPRELLQELRMTPPVPVRKRRKSNVGGDEDIT